MRKKISTLLILAFILTSASCGKNSDGETSKDDNSPDLNISVVSNENENSEYEKTSKSESSRDIIVAPNEIYSNPEEDSVIKEFLSFFESGEYVKATEYYNNEILGSIEYETAASEEVEKMLIDLKRDVLNGTAEDRYVSNVYGVAQNLVFETSIDVDFDLFEETGAAIKSRKGFISGKSKEEAQLYVEAINDYVDVIPEDPNYQQALEGIERCKSVLRKDYLDTAKKYADDNDYLSALSEIRALDEIIPDDTEIITQLEIYEALYVEQVLDEAKELFVSYSDYTKALEIINETLMFMKDNEKLNDAKEYYESFAPVYLYDTNKLKGSADTLETDTDIFGNNYEKCFWAGYKGMIWHETDISYYLDKNYNTFSATMYSRSSKNEAQNMTVEIYADDKSIYHKTFADNSTQPFEIDLDVTGVSTLRIVLTRSKGAIGSGIGMTDMVVQKTVK